MLSLIIPSLVTYFIWFAKYNEMFAATCTNTYCTIRSLDEMPPNQVNPLPITYDSGLKNKRFFMIYPTYPNLSIKDSTLRIIKIHPVTEDHISISGFYEADQNKLKNLLINEANEILNKETEIEILGNDSYFVNFIDRPLMNDYPKDDIEKLNKPNYLFINKINIWKNILPEKRFITKINDITINEKGEVQIEASTSTNFANNDDNRIYIRLFIDAQLEEISGIDNKKGLLDNLPFSMPEALSEYRKNIFFYNTKHVGLILIAELLFFLFIFCLIKAVKQERNNS